MFTERFNEIIRVLGVERSAELARGLHCEPSYISILRSGRRIPAPGSQAAIRLAEGLTDLARELDRLPALRELLGCDLHRTPRDMAARLADWLTEGETVPLRRGGRQAAEDRRDTIRLGERLGSLMELCGLNNAHLARLAGVDPSVISRYKSGRAVPPADREVSHRIARALFRRAMSPERAADLAALTGIPRELLEAESEGYAAFFKWMQDPAQGENTVIRRFLAGFDDYTPVSLPGLLSAEEQAEPEEEPRESYRGREGLRAAVLRFLRTAAERRTPELLLYSDESMDWLTEDRIFLLRWARRMEACIRGGVRIRIIHNIDRGLEEMTAAIRGWLPLYMSGRIEGFYSTRPGGSRFSHTLFLAPGQACICGWQAAGDNAGGVWRYVTDPGELEDCRSMFRGLLDDARSLIRITPSGVQEPYPLPSQASRGIRTILNAPSLGTMPLPLLQRMGERAGLDRETAARLRRTWELEREQFLLYLENGFVQEFFSLPAPEELQAGRTAADTAAAPLFYTPAEYGEHLRALRARLADHANYRVILLPEPAFAHLRISISGTGVTIRRLTPPHAAFTVTHPLMQTAFQGYAEELYRRSSLSREALEEQLDRWLGRL